MSTDELSLPLLVVTPESDNWNLVTCIHWLPPILTKSSTGLVGRCQRFKDSSSFSSDVNLHYSSNYSYLEEINNFDPITSIT